MITAALLCFSVLMQALSPGGPPSGAIHRPTGSAPSVLFIVLDDVGWPEVPELPSLKEVSSRGVTFERFYSWPVCSPTRYSALAGRYPRRAGIGDVINAHNSNTGASPAPNRLDLCLSEAMLPSRETALFGKWHLGRLSVGNRDDLLALTQSGPFGSGFPVWRAGNPNSIGQPVASNNGYYDWYRVDDDNVNPHSGEYATAAQRDAFVSWWTTTTGPKFCWLAFNAAHAPYDPPPGMIPTGSVRGDYLQVVHYLDGALDAVFGAVDFSTTFVFVFGDNGTPDDARPNGPTGLQAPSGFWKGSTYEGGINVPLFVAGPGVTPGIVSQRLTSSVDLPATALELAGVPISRGFEDSQSFADAMGSTWTGSAPRTWIFSERYDTPGGGSQVEGYDDQAVVEAVWKLRRVDADGIGPGGTVDHAYHLVADPYEIAPIDPLLLPASIRTRLYAELAQLPPRAP